MKTIKEFYENFDFEKVVTNPPKLIQEFLDGEIKFRANNDWGVNYGDNGGDGTLELNGGNIPSTAGTYNIELDFSDPNNPTWTYY